VAGRATRQAESLVARYNFPPLKFAQECCFRVISKPNILKAYEYCVKYFYNNYVL